MNKITISTETALDLMRRNPFSLDISDQTRPVLAQLCNVEQVSDISLPRAITAVRPHLRKHIPWLTSALDYLEAQQGACDGCEIDHTDNEAMRKCPVNHAFAGLLMLHDATWEVPPLPVDAYTQSNDKAEEVMNTLDWVVAQASATEAKSITVILVEEPEPEAKDNYRWN